MTILYAPLLRVAIDNTVSAFHKYATLVHTERWQGVDVSKKPDMATWEMLDHSLRADLNDAVDLDHFRKAVKPSLPWADNHFLERVSGKPLNPGEQWAHWPWAQSARNFLDTQVTEEGNKGFSHTYMERYWPRYAGPKINESYENEGIRHRYGDLEDLVELLVKEQDTRQAFFPVWFPEDTGAHNTTRKPCTLGYWFVVRDGQLHTTYYIRSCDIMRHFRDDVYLTVRLALWLIDQCKQRHFSWQHIAPGRFTMHIGSLHCFRNDWKALFGEDR